MNQYLQLNCYPDVPHILKALQDAGKQTNTLSNGSHDMLYSAVTNSTLGKLLDPSLSLNDVGVFFKVDSHVDEMTNTRFSCEPRAICFMYSNAWDTWAASHFRLQVAWINCFGQPPEHLPGRLSAKNKKIDKLSPLLGL